MKLNSDKVTECLLEKPYWVIDFLPMQVPMDSRGQFFAVERYHLTAERHARLCRQFADVMLGLNCYHDLTVNNSDGDWVKNPEPTTLVTWLNEAMQNGNLSVLIDDDKALITASGGDTNLTVYNPPEGLLHLLRLLSAAAGLHLWRPQ